MRLDVCVRKAMLGDVDAIKRIADENRSSIGFLRRAVIEQATQSGEVFVATVTGKVVGFQIYYHRKTDGQTTLHSKCVMKHFRRRGIATQLVDAVSGEARSLRRGFLLLKCPADLSSNEFHRKYGFVKTRLEKGKKRDLNVWVLPLASID